MIAASQFDTKALGHEWRWLVPESDTPLFISIFGDWVFGHPNGSLWALSVLEGTYEQIARNTAEYNALNKSFEWLDATFIAGWREIAARHGLEPADGECLGWKVHPIIGGKFEVENLAIFRMLVYQSLMGQLHRQLRSPTVPSSGGIAARDT
jgi:hypothetical protein